VVSKVFSLPKLSDSSLGRIQASLNPRQAESGDEEAHRDYEEYLRQLEEVLNASGVEYDATIIGEVPEGPILLYRPLDEGHGDKHLLCISGQHGEELAGPWALLEGLRQCPEVLQKHNVSIIPVGNPTGFVTGDRNGHGGKKTNWMLDDDMQLRTGPEVGPEVQALIDHCDLLSSECAQDGLLNVHEDNTSQGFYLYVFGDTSSPVVDDMLQAGLQEFEFKKDGTYHDNDSYDLEDGVVDNHPDHSFDHYAYSEGTSLAVTIELPATKGIEFDQRVRSGAAMVSAFLQGLKKTKTSRRRKVGDDKIYYPPSPRDPRYNYPNPGDTMNYIPEVGDLREVTTYEELEDLLRTREEDLEQAQAHLEQRQAELAEVQAASDTALANHDSWGAEDYESYSRFIKPKLENAEYNVEWAGKLIVDREREINRVKKMMKTYFSEEWTFPQEDPYRKFLEDDLASAPSEENEDL
jgi:hypothetical protein